MVSFNENIHNGNGFLLGQMNTQKTDLTNELAEGGASPIREIEK
jgi:hypothetical protein